MSGPMVVMSGSSVGLHKRQDTMKTADLALCGREWDGTVIQQRVTDGYVHATGMAKANGKHLPHYLANARTQAYIAELAAVVGIPTTGNEGLIQTRQGGRPDLQGTWVHPRLAIDLARWISPAFAVWMDGWFLDWLQGRITSAQQPTHHPNPFADDGHGAFATDNWVGEGPYARENVIAARLWSRYRTSPVRRWMAAPPATRLAMSLSHLVEDYELGLIDNTPRAASAIGMAAAMLCREFPPSGAAIEERRGDDHVLSTCITDARNLLERTMAPASGTTTRRRRRLAS